MKKSELLPCPFCGGEARMVVLTSYPPKYQVEHACEVVCAKPAETPEQAIKAWNTRAETVPPIDDLIDALRDGWNIEASWDGLRKFWYVGLTEEGVRERDERDRAERDLRDEVNWMHSELHGAEMAASGETVLLDEQYSHALRLVEELHQVLSLNGGGVPR